MMVLHCGTEPQNPQPFLLRQAPKMMKTASAPRRIYTRNDVVHVCFSGKYFGPTGESALSLDHPVTLALLDSDGGRARVEVTQKRKGQPTKTETWRSVNVPRNARS